MFISSPWFIYRHTGKLEILHQHNYGALVKIITNLLIGHVCKLHYAYMFLHTCRYQVCDYEARVSLATIAYENHKGHEQAKTKDGVGRQVFFDSQ